MSKVVTLGHRRIALRFCAAAAVAALMAGCSTDSTRLSDPFSNPFATASNEPVRQPTAQHSGTIPAGRSPPIVSQALPPRSSNVASAAAPAPLRPQLTATYRAAPVSHETTGSIEPGPSRFAPGAAYGGWTSNGGVPVTVAQGETLDVLSKRYGVPSTALLQTNGLHGAADVRPGAQLTIPVYNAVAAAHQQATPLAAAEPVRAVPRVEPPHVAEAAPQRGKPLAKAALLKPRTELAPGPRPLALPTRQVASAPQQVAPSRSAMAKPEPKTVGTQHSQQMASAETAAPKPVHGKPVVEAPAKVAAAAKPIPSKAAPAVTTPAPAKSAPVAVASRQPDPTPTASVAPAAAPAPATNDASGNPEFRWPARGRIIQGFKSGNDGINIAVPEGTSVKAAEGGTVAYAGSELKGYGNLVLIRHPNGFVTAYANNGEIDVKRGDQVKRGQTIAKSGQSGNVTSPQLHFELRKGSTPVDPTSYLAGL